LTGNGLGVHYLKNRNVVPLLQSFLKNLVDLFNEYKRV